MCPSPYLVMVVLSGILQGMYPLQLVWAGQVSHGHCLLRHELGTEQGHKWGAPGGVEPWRGMSVFHPNTPSAKQTWKEEQALAAMTEDGIGSSV